MGISDYIKEKNKQTYELILNTNDFKMIKTEFDKLYKTFKKRDDIDIVNFKITINYYGNESLLDYEEEE